MNEIKCPKCGTVITIDEGTYSDIVSQIKKDELEKEWKRREAELTKQHNAELDLEKQKNQNQLDKKLGDQTSLIQDLKNQIDALKKEKADAVALEASKKEVEIAELKGKLANAEQSAKLQVQEAIGKEKDKQSALELKNKQLEGEIKTKEQAAALEIKTLKDAHAVQIKLKDDEVAFYKEMKAKLSTKDIGESLEQYCLNEFNKIRSVTYPRAYFEKDNVVVEGTKGDFVFKNFDENGTEYLSIMFEMKNEADETRTKHKNEDFFKKLDEDRKKKGCKYAVLVSMLEQDNELYNAGIVDMSYRYQDMYVIRPQFFLPLIALLDGATRQNARAIALLADERQRNLDVTTFENNLLEFKTGFEKNCATAQKYFEDAIKRIDDTIKDLEKIKADLTTSNRQLSHANDKAQDLTIKKLTKNCATVAAKFNAIETTVEEK